MKRTAMILFIAACALACNPATRTPHNAFRTNAASMFTQRYATSRLSAWHVRANPAGSDCAVLLVETSVVLEDAMVEAMHYGFGAYDVYEGGVQQFSRDRTFRGVVYKDATGHRWNYGVSVREARDVEPCR
jgi:hypothetical protein